MQTDFSDNFMLLEPRKQEVAGILDVSGWHMYVVRLETNFTIN